VKRRRLPGLYELEPPFEIRVQAHEEEARTLAIGRAVWRPAEDTVAIGDGELFLRSGAKLSQRIGAADARRTGSGALRILGPVHKSLSGFAAYAPHFLAVNFTRYGATGRRDGLSCAGGWGGAMPGGEGLT
jgi:hypothetical protein